MSSTYEITGAVFDLTYVTGMIISGTVMMRRGQEIIARKVDARGGRPVSDFYARTIIGWVAVKTVLWPLNLIVWLALGRPEPGRYTVDDECAMRSASEPSDSSSRSRNDAALHAPTAPPGMTASAPVGSRRPAGTGRPSAMH